MSGTGVSPIFSASGSLAASGSSDSFALSGPFNLTLSGTWVGSVVVDASTDRGATFVNCPGGNSPFTQNGLYPAPNVWERGVLFRVTFTRTSGTLDWRLSQ